LQADQLLRERSRPIDVTAAPTKVHPHVAAIGPTQARKRLNERRNDSRHSGIVFNAPHEQADASHLLWLLRPCRERPCRRASRPDRNILHLHGGAFLIGSPSMYRHITWRLASATHARVLSIDYRLAPEHPFPAAIEDAVAAYCSLIAGGADPRQLAVIGDSAGGGLAFAMLQKLRDDGVQLPAAAVVLSPWTDLALAGASVKLHADADPMVDVRELTRAAEYYLAGADDPAGLPPTLIQVGSDEVLRDDAVRMADRMRPQAAGSSSKYGRACPMHGSSSRPCSLRPPARSACVSAP
jgi:acetyl esterase/lipase